MGRLPLLIAFEPLSAAELVAILDHHDVSPLASWQRYFDVALGTRLRFDEAAKWVVAERAAAMGLGARGLQHVLFPLLAAKAAEAMAQPVAQPGQGELVLRAADVMPETVAVPIAARVQ